MQNYTCMSIIYSGERLLNPNKLLHGFRAVKRRQKDRAGENP